jgi:hypothetical protein
MAIQNFPLRICNLMVFPPPQKVMPNCSYRVIVGATPVPLCDGVQGDQPCPYSFLMTISYNDGQPDAPVAPVDAEQPPNEILERRNMRK